MTVASGFRLGLKPLKGGEHLEHPQEARHDPGPRVQVLDVDRGDFYIRPTEAVYPTCAWSANARCPPFHQDCLAQCRVVPPSHKLVSQTPNNSINHGVSTITSFPGYYVLS